MIASVVLLLVGTWLLRSRPTAGLRPVLDGWQKRDGTPPQVVAGGEPADSGSKRAVEDGLHVSGHVSHSDGRPATGATVVARRKDREVLAKVTDDGSYRVNLIDPGAYQFTFRAATGNNCRVREIDVGRSVSGVDETLDPDSTLSLLVVEEAGTGLAAKVVVSCDADRLIAGVLDHRQQFRHFECDAAGRVQISGLRSTPLPGSNTSSAEAVEVYRIGVSHSGYAAKTECVAIRPGENRVTIVLDRVAATRIRGTVLSPDGTLQAGALIDAVYCRGESSRRGVLKQAAGPTAHAGTYEFSCDAPTLQFAAGKLEGKVVVRARHPDFADGFATVESFSSGDDVSGVVVRLEATSLVRGSVRDEDGKPVPGTILRLHRLDTPAGDFFDLPEVTCDESGNFEARLARDGLYRFVPEADGYRCENPETGEHEPVIIQMPILRFVELRLARSF
jgi:hypothetical protein